MAARTSGLFSCARARASTAPASGSPALPSLKAADLRASGSAPKIAKLSSARWIDPEERFVDGHRLRPGLKRRWLTLGVEHGTAAHVQEAAVVVSITRRPCHG